MNRLRRFFSMIMVLVMVLSLTPMNVEAATVKLNKTKVTTYVGKTVSLKVKGTKNKVKWSSSNKKVAKVTSKGKVTAKKSGTAKITAKVNNKKLTCKVTVKNPYLNENDISLKQGDTFTLNLTGSKAKVWSSSNVKVATVDTKGKVSAIGIGTTIIKVKAANKKSYSCTVTVTEAEKEPEPEPHKHNYIGSVTKESTCKEEGIITYTCSCGDAYTKTIEKVDHIFGENVNTKVVSCTEDGENSSICTVCGYVEVTIIESPGHSMVDGICTICGYDENKYIHKHQYSISEIYEATCVEEGTTMYICECGDSYSEVIPTIDHTPSDWIIDKEATCKENGAKYKECTICQSILENKVVEKVDHNMVDGKCSNCDYEEIEDHTHNYVGKVTKESTCKVEGIITYLCECGDTYTEPIEMKNHISSNWITDKEATCKENGSKHKECTICKSVLETETIKKITHNMVDGKCNECGYEEAVHTHSYVATETKSATCVKEGVITYECECGDSYSETIPTIDHTSSDWIISKEVTCTTNGSRYKECEICKEVLESETIISNGHNYVDTIIEPTCTDMGYTIHVCSGCDDNYIDSFKDPIIHIYKGEVTKAATCKNEGEITYSCVCGVSYTEPIEKVEHIESDWIVYVDSTCTQKGLKYKECTICKKELETEYINEKEHIESDWIVIQESTCSEKGSRYKECDVCHGIMESEEIELKEHTPSDWIVVKEAICTNPGEKKKECEVCHKVLDIQNIEMLAHTPSEWIVDLEPTCEDKGSKHTECVVCGEYLETKSIEEKGHISTDWIVVKEATCTNPGEKKKECEVCHKTIEIGTVEKKGHTPSEWIVDIEPTCEEQGSKHTECVVCGEYLETKSIELKGHTPSEWIVVKEATCTNLGEQYKECVECQHILDVKTISMIDHDYEDKIVEPTCTEYGYTIHTCSLCGDSYQDSYTEKIEHTLSDWIVSQESTCTENGAKYQECTICGKVCEEGTIAKLGHNYKEISYSEPTCTKDGVQMYECSNCHDIKTTTIEATGHTHGHFVETIAPVDFETFGSANMVCPTCEEVLYADLTAVLIDLGNDETTTIYGYYDYDEAYKNFELTLDYKKTHTDSDGESLYDEEYGFEWDEEMYNFSCIRCAEEVYMVDTYTTNYKFPVDENGNELMDLHTRPNGGDGPGSENAIECGGMSAEYALQSWLDSPGHKYAIEQMCWNRISVAVFKGWSSQYNTFIQIWIQNYARTL